MHIYRRQARNLAWYDQEGEPSNHNPFKKFRSRPRRSNSYQMESGLVPVRTAGEVRMSEERRRRRDMTDGLAGPEHADTFPPESSGTDGLHRAESAEKSEPEPSMRSHEPINVSNQEEEQDEIPEGKPRKRKTFMSGYGSRSEDGDAPSSVEGAKDVPDKQKFTAVGQLKATLFNSWMNLLLIAAPVGIALNYVDVDPVAVFVVNFIAIIPLAAMLSYATEEIAIRTGETIGGLLNASFGNAVELIVAIIALVDKEVLIVQTSLIGSMLSNLLLVLGMCFFFGGVNRLEQHFNPVVAQTAASLLALAVASLIIPTAFHAWSGAGTVGIAPLSRGTSIILLFVYGCYLFFQLKSHTEIYNRPSPKVEKRRQKIGKMTATMGGQNAQQMKIHEEDDEEQPQLSIWVAVLTLAISTTFVALCAEFMVGSIDALTERGGISKTFVGLILLPIVGNAAEHATAVTVACKDKMDLAIGVAVGSSMQIALLVLPLIIVIGWIMGLEDMTLYFDAFQVILLFVSVLLVNYLIADGKSHWLEGVLLLTMYLIIAVAAWFYPNKTEAAA
ncbi:putative sodium/calcium transporter [Aspergillus novofumigatus IBT 16806]|uniref:Vacuolar calcium ion transporter n=1 Tax=Aspergillus novofumigatus (strain IBT 16806) TaxID=1392255 RepID=A0A2I1CLG6_ASPN1|nr:putative sodium/calcium transporter [Aspergillus novofumigatus IBT 16806]PKX98463.1 putative sodium/calcium transporter [Aspergillus novofumigatus IBT 16806]